MGLLLLLLWKNSDVGPPKFLELRHVEDLDLLWAGEDCERLKPRTLWVWEGDGILELGNFREDIAVHELADAISEHTKLGGDERALCFVCVVCFVTIFGLFKDMAFLARGKF